jgi:CO/xanthine dehydrogenase FAD-binding subunit
LATLQPFDYIIPKDYQEASALLAAGNGSVRALQGGTDLLIRIRGGFVQPERVIDLKNLPGMREIRLSDDGWLVIGAACTMNQVGLHPQVRERYGVLSEGCNSVASYQLRNRATIGGNLCNASPAADAAPALLCLEGVVEIFGPAGTRRASIDDFFTGPGRTVLRKGEFLTGIHLPPLAGRSAGAYNKLGRTRIGDIALVSVAVHCVRAESATPGGGATWRIAIGAAGPTPLRAPDAERSLAQDASLEGVARAAGLAASAARPIDDIRGSATYRRAMVRVLARRGIERVLAALHSQSAPPATGGQA